MVVKPKSSFLSNGGRREYSRADLPDIHELYKDGGRTREPISFFNMYLAACALPLLRIGTQGTLATFVQIYTLQQAARTLHLLEQVKPPCQ